MQDYVMSSDVMECVCVCVWCVSERDHVLNVHQYIISPLVLACTKEQITTRR